MSASLAQVSSTASSLLACTLSRDLTNDFNNQLKLSERALDRHQFTLLFPTLNANTPLHSLSPDRISRNKPWIGHHCTLLLVPYARISKY